MEKHIKYSIDGIDFASLGVYVSGSSGIVDSPKRKPVPETKWDDYHGASVDLSHKLYDQRKITLNCFIIADSKDDFVVKLLKFRHIFDKPGYHRLMIEAVSGKPLIYEVYSQDEIAVSKKWSESQMVGTFDLRLTEPQPEKKVLAFGATAEAKTCTIKMNSPKMIDVFWGDGEVAYDVSGQSIDLSHTYKANGDYYIAVVGCIDEIVSIETNAKTIWNKL